VFFVAPSFLAKGKSLKIKNCAASGVLKRRLTQDSTAKDKADLSKANFRSS